MDIFHISYYYTALLYYSNNKNVNDARSTADLVYRLNCLRTSDEDKALIRKNYEVLMEISTSLAVLFRYFYPIKIPNANEAVPIIELVSEINFQSAMIQNLIKAVHLNKSLLHITGILIQSDDVQVLQYTIKTLINLLALRHEPIFARLHNHITLPRIFEVFTSGSPRLYEPALQLLNRLVMVEHSHSVLTIGIKLIPSMKGMIQNYKKLSITNLESILLILTNLILTDRILLQKIIDEDVVLDVINCVKQMPSLSWSLTDISRNAIYSGTKEQTQKLDAIFKDHDDLPCMKELRYPLSCSKIIRLIEVSSVSYLQA
ncbi:uncharacterized protein TRIADDRAFT_54152 [Trichoplax adhaerens]|uniref:Armadillo repeat-containing domain-containing protein n=1 Tax=Trichoplax adhaerens TaxID=10228 RepID=B3RR92_TRIAD|nr:predicted protein [Trichoplax adhaerens]EDV26836.1 predicted protein [Trichoplax adhaerens]|eukprot:XP_002110832.1 predicted protein [Trichoplax adhaerens]